MDKKETVQLHAIARGRVQGVFFRDTTRNYAEQQGLVGTVRNLPDGTVEIIAVGDEASCTKLLSLLQENAGMGKIESFTSRFSPPNTVFSSFSVVCYFFLIKISYNINVGLFF